MNRFRTKKRAKDDLAAGRTSEDSEQSSLSFFRKGKKSQQEESKKEFDLTTALPTNDDFRTSLLMNNLSARFSMLREQDDPNTKIGKASDDSVLYPKRQSRMADFGFGHGAGLSDIAEVESIRGTGFPRATSVGSDETDSANGGSVLTRGRPTEGNVLFGGRQKIYKIPAASEGGMAGRAVYEDDVAVSAFQRWRQTERQKTLEGLTGPATDEDEPPRSESPPSMRFGNKRETASTTSSASMMARNSTAATSVTSQIANIKEAQSLSSAASSAVTSPIPERNVIRTRRLYEQHSNQDAKENAPGSVLSRIEALTRPRPFNTRTPDLPIRSDNNRTILNKTSAPSLRSLSPKPVGRPIGDLDAGVKSQLETKRNDVGGVPASSSPASETGEQVVLPILAKDVGKATAMGIFQKPTQSYDESQYVQRQLQLQQGRETPTLMQRTDTSGRNTPVSAEPERKPVTIGVRPPVPNVVLPPTPATETGGLSSAKADSTTPEPASIPRPSDKDHPAFRQSPLPSLPSNRNVSREKLLGDDLRAPADGSRPASPEDSPTLGPTSGLSGLVRQHLRTESVESSLNRTSINPISTGSRFNFDSGSPSLLAETGVALSPWPSSDQDWIGPGPVSESKAATPEVRESEPESKPDVSATPTPDRTSTATDDEVDDFANQLANARRRVREKLTSYVESDSSRAPSPSLLPVDSSSLSGPPPNGTGILKPKTSRGSLIDRTRNVPTGPPKNMKIIGLGASTQPGKDEKDHPSLETMKEEGERDEGINAHPGLKAFRQARRELQKRKELETLARHQAAQTSQPLDESPEQRPDVPASRGQRTPSRDRKPPPVSYRQPPPVDDHSYSSPPGARPSGERSRSGSEASNGRSNSRPPRLRTSNNTSPHEQYGPPSQNRPMLRSPAIPGPADSKGSYFNRGAPSPAPSPHPDRSWSSTNLALHTGRPGLDQHSGQPSPISPMGLPSPSPYTSGPSPAGTPTTLGPRPRLSSASQSPALGPSHHAGSGPAKRAVDKREISEPTFVMSTSRVPTNALPHHAPPQSHPPQYPPPPRQAPPMIPTAGTRSRSSSRAADSAPPLPPINPRRRREDSRPRQSTQNGEMTSPRMPYPSSGIPSPTSDDEPGNRPEQRRVLRKPPPDMPGTGPRPPPGMMRDTNPPFLAKGPPTSRSAPPGQNMGGLPGGMI
ncbi:hypothetical protein B0J18DRAFT_372145 [Chaetomium sp. MPI-SDFR-AT-0129]|nr:hypothetical protein B0J18DRAFT_372145 [Chaetomium sp. MPI-SDFR-AT-0129]